MTFSSLPNIFNIVYVVIAILIVIVVLLALRIARRLLHRLSMRAYAYDQDLLLIRVPKERPRDVEEEQTTQNLQEDIAAA